MILLRVLILIGIAAMLWLLWRRLRGAPGDQRPQEAFERMVPCAICATHVPEKQAIRRGDAYYCEQHGGE